jgi:5-methylcytosine-specific restriction enzyme A
LKESEWFFSDPQHIRREKEKARQIRQSQWWKNLRARNHCHYCGKTVPARKLSMDHRIPISRGGMSERKNLVPSCKSCNNKKKNMMLDEWEVYLVESEKSEQDIS